jgi:hypothetical protein
MPPLKDVTTMITAARSRRIRFTMIIQNFAQLDEVYGKENSETLRGNCGNLIYLITTELKALEEISKMCGEVKSKKDDKTASTPLVTVSDLQRMKENDVIILRLRMQPFKTHFTPNYKLDWGKKFPSATYPTRAKQEVHIFDIKEFVKNQKKKKLLDMMNAADEEDENKLNDPNVSSEDINVLDAPAPKQIPNNTPLTDFDYPSPINNSSAITNTASATENSEDGDFDVDELVRKIDAKIAELEQEEKSEQNANISTNEAEVVPTTNVVEQNMPSNNYEILEDSEEATTVPVTSANDNLAIDDNDDKDDDEFFDDFFDN